MKKTFIDIQQIIKDVSCAPYEFRFACIQCVREPKTSHAMVKNGCVDDTHSWFLQACLWRADTNTGIEGWGFGTKNFISPWQTEGEIVKRCLVAARDYSEHEVREAFMYKGRRIFGPHVSIAALWKIADDIEIRSPMVEAEQAR